MTHWFHPGCAAYKRPEPVLEALGQASVPDAETLARRARANLAQPRLQRIDGAERAPTGQAKCRQCREPIERGTWRIRLVFHEEGTFSPGGFVHLACRLPYFETGEIAAPLLHFSAALTAEDREALQAALAQAPA